MGTKALLAGLAALVVVGGIAIGVTQYIFRPSNDEAAALVPEDAQFYMNVFLRPSNGQKQAIEDLLGAGDVTADEATDKIAAFVDRALEDVGLTFEDDIDPAIGSQAAVFAGDLGANLEPAEATAPLTDEMPESAEAAVLVAVKDGKARDLIEVANDQGDAEVTGQETYEGYEYTVYDDESAVGFVGDFAVAGTEAGFRAVVDTAEGGESLEGSDAYADVTARLNDDNLGVLYFNFASFIDQARESGAVMPEDESALELLGDSFERPFAMTVFAASEGIVVESASPVPSEGPVSDIVGVLMEEANVAELPSDAWVAFGLPGIGRLAELLFDLGRSLDEATDADLTELAGRFERETGLNLREHVFEGLEGMRFFVSGGIGPGTRGALVVQTSNEVVATDVVGALRTLAKDQGVGTQELGLAGYDNGFSFTDPSAKDSVHVVADGARIVAGFGTDATLAVLEGGESLADTEKFAGATELLGDYEPYFYLDLDPPLAAFRNLLAPQIPGYPAATLDPFLDAASHMTGGARRDGDYVMQRLIVGVE
jgi:hypothetical protein